MKIAFRADASSLIGSGHVMRCLALAETLREHGHRCEFIMRQLPGNLIDAVRTQGHSVCPLPWSQEKTYQGDSYAEWLGVSLEDDLEEARDQLRQIQADWLVVDHYSLGASWEKAMRSVGSRLLVIDDLANRAHECEILIDQNLSKEQNQRYQKWVSPSTAQLLGPSYALLRKEFHARRAQGIPSRSSTIRRVVISFGGVDLPNATLRALEALKSLNRPELHIDVVVGSTNPHFSSLETFAHTMKGVKFHRQANNMAELFAGADLGIGAPGSTCWERCCVGLPSILIALALNQKLVGENCQKEKIATYLGPLKQTTALQIVDAVAHLEKGDRLAQMSHHAAQVVDGLGTGRIVDRMTKLSEHAPKEITPQC